MFGRCLVSLVCGCCLTLLEVELNRRHQTGDVQSARGSSSRSRRGCDHVVDRGLAEGTFDRKEETSFFDMSSAK